MRGALASIIHLLLLDSTDLINKKNQFLFLSCSPSGCQDLPSNFFFIIVSLLSCGRWQLFSLKQGPQSHDETQRNSTPVIHLISVPSFVSCVFFFNSIVAVPYSRNRHRELPAGVRAIRFAFQICCEIVLTHKANSSLAL